MDTYSTLLYDLGNSRYMVKDPIPIVISCHYEHIFVEWPEMALSANGHLEHVAIENFRKFVIERFERLRQLCESDQELTEYDEARSRILERCITKLGN